MNGVTTYWLMAEPPFAGATHVTRTEPVVGPAFNGAAAGFAGAAGTVAAPAGRMAAVGTSANAATRSTPNFRLRHRIPNPPGSPTAAGRRKRYGRGPPTVHRARKLSGRVQPTGISAAGKRPLREVHRERLEAVQDDRVAVAGPFVAP